MMSSNKNNTIRAVFWGAMLVTFARIEAESNPLSGEPKIIEVGPTFRSPLGDITIGSDANVWAGEADGAARLTRDGTVTQFRGPGDGGNANVDTVLPMGIGPDNAVWMNAGNALWRFGDRGVQQFGMLPAAAYGHYEAFASSQNGVYTSRAGESGIRRLQSDGTSVHLIPALDGVRAIIPARNGGLWLVIGPENWWNGGVPLSLAFFNGVDVTTAIAASYFGTHPMTERFASAPDGGLVADVSTTGSTDESIIHVARDAEVTVLGVLAAPALRWPPTLVGALTVASDGAVWCTEPYRNRVERIATDGTLRDYRAAIPDGSMPTGITADDDGSVWFTDVARATIDHITPSGHVKIFGNGLSPINIPGPPVITSDGALWFREENPGHQRIARIALDGTLREFVDPFVPRGSFGGSLPALQPAGTGVSFSDERGQHDRALTMYADGATQERSLASGCIVSQTNFACFPDRVGARPFADERAFPTSVVLGPDKNLWFTDVVNSVIVKVSTNGKGTHYTRGLSRWNSGPGHITVGPDGALWFTELRDRVGRITMDGHITEFSAGLPRRSSIGGIVTGPDKNLWFTLYHGNELVRMTTAGAIRRFRNGIYPSRGRDNEGIVHSVPFVDRSGHVWFNEPQGGRIARASIQ